MFYARRKIIMSIALAAAAVLLCVPIFAAVTEEIAVPPVFLATRGAERPIELRALDIKADISGGYAWTTVEMTFFNPNDRVLEGELQFPLPDGAAVTGFAL